MDFTRKTPWFWVLILLIIEQGIKLIINKHYLYAEYPLIKPFLSFSPVFNRDYSWFNSMLGLNIGRSAHTLLVSVMLILIYFAYQYILSLGERIS